MVKSRDLNFEVSDHKIRSADSDIPQVCGAMSLGTANLWPAPKGKG